MIQLAQPIIGDDEVDAVSRVLRSGALAQGPEVAQFEAEFSSAVDGRACVAVNSGTSALHLLLLAFDIGPGDEVIVPSFSFAATANAVALTGATPVFADIDLESLCLDPEAAERLLSPRTKAEARSPSCSTAIRVWPTRSARPRASRGRSRRAERRTSMMRRWRR